MKFFLSFGAWLSLSISLIFLRPTTVQAQTSDLSSLMQEITYGDDTLRSVYDWVANHIIYDVDLINANKKYFSEEQMVKEVIQKRSGVCQHYAELLNAILQKLGYQSYVVVGYTRQNDRIDTELGHAWNAVKLADGWYMFDPTWSAGYVKQNRFIRHYNGIWYKVPPEEFIYTHIPFDPLWQLIDSPLTHIDVKEKRFQVHTENYRSGEVNRLVAAYVRQDEGERMRSAIRRIERAGVTNWLIRTKLDEYKERLYLMEQNRQIAQMNEGVFLLNQVIEDYNLYNLAKYRRFKSPRWSDQKILYSLSSMDSRVKAVYQRLGDITASDMRFRTQLKRNRTLAEDLMKKVATEYAFANRYTSTWKIFRAFVFK